MSFSVIFHPGKNATLTRVALTALSRGHRGKESCVSFRTTTFSIRVAEIFSEQIKS